MTTKLESNLPLFHHQIKSVHLPIFVSTGFFSSLFRIKFCLISQCFSVQDSALNQNCQNFSENLRFFFPQLLLQLPEEKGK